VFKHNFGRKFSHFSCSSINNSPRFLCGLSDFLNFFAEHKAPAVEKPVELVTYLIAEEIFENRIEEGQSFHKSHQVDELNDEFLGIFGEFAVIV